MTILLFVVLSFLSSCVFSAENCSIYVNPNVSVGLPDQVVCKRNETYTIIEVDPDETGAKCLDGSNYKFMIHKGSGSNKNKFHFYFQGAAYCGSDGYETLESCYYRSLTNLGSSTSIGTNGSTYTKNISIGYASSDKETNPTFHDWNIMFIVYCDGTNSQGYLEQPLYYNNTPLWFRGFNNTLSVFEYARKNMGLFDAETVLISGGSSGGTSALVWASYLQDYFPKNVRLLGLSDGGLFLDVYNNASGCNLFRFFMQNLAYLTNANTSELYKKCPFNKSMETVWKCMIPQYIFEFIEIDFFIANSQNDVEQLASQYGVNCLVDGGPLFCDKHDEYMITRFREEHLKVALKIKKNKPTWGFWLRTCFEHTYQFTWAWYGSTMNVFNAELGISLGLKDALDFWYNDGKATKNNTAFIDLLDWKHNPECVYDELYRYQDKSS